MAHQNRPEQAMSNLRLSTEVINLSAEGQNGELVITNTHQSYSLLFKIKTKIEKVLEVRPSRGLVKPGEKIMVSFKPFSKLSEAERSKYEKALQFLLQGVNLLKQEISKEEEEALWKSVKQKKADISLGYCAVKIGINMSGTAEQKEFVPSFASYESRIDNKFSSHLKSDKSDKSASSVHELNNFRSELKDLSKNDTQLSQRYAQLKGEHEQLEREREKLFSVKGTGGGKSNSKAIKIVLIFVVFFLLGNFLRGVIEPPPKPEVVVEKGWFSSLFG